MRRWTVDKKWPFFGIGNKLQIRCDLLISVSLIVWAMKLISHHFRPQNRILHPKIPPGTSSEVCTRDFYWVEKNFGKFQKKLTCQVEFSTFQKCFKMNTAMFQSCSSDVSEVEWCSTSPSGGDQVDGLPPAPVWLSTVILVKSDVFVVDEIDSQYFFREV